MRCALGAVCSGWRRRTVRFAAEVFEAVEVLAAAGLAAGVALAEVAAALTTGLVAGLAAVLLVVGELLVTSLVSLGLRAELCDSGSRAALRDAALGLELAWETAVRLVTRRAEPVEAHSEPPKPDPKLEKMHPQQANRRIARKRGLEGFLI